jgi:hypothetical protein
VRGQREKNIVVHLDYFNPREMMRGGGGHRIVYEYPHGFLKRG